MTLLEIFAILLIHWYADFVDQTNDEALNKSISNRYLTAHVLGYSLVWMYISVIYYSATDNSWILLFSPITFVCHWVTDYFTSREVRKSFSKQDWHNGFVKIGVDQVLHYIQLFFLYELLKTHTIPSFG